MARIWARRPKLKTIVGAVIALGTLGLMAATFEALAVAHLKDPVLDTPTRIYARPLALYPGLRPDRETVRTHLESLGYKSAGRREVNTGEYYLGERLWIIGRRAFRHHYAVDPPLTAVLRMGLSGRIGTVEDQDGVRLTHLALEPEYLGPLEAGRTTTTTVEDRLPVRLHDVPQHLVDAVLTIEDQRFFKHRGFDPLRIVGAAIANLKAGRVVQGGSTLTQQLAKSLWLSRERTLLRKTREAMMAVVLEGRYGKERILEAYLNEIYLGQNGSAAIHGVARAAQHYFGKDVTELQLAESALLAGVARGPSLYSPFRNPESALARRDLVLRRMAERGVITEEQLTEALELPIQLRERRRRTGGARYFLDYVRRELREGSGSEAAGPDSAGLAVFTSLDMSLQRAADQAVREGLARLEDWYPDLLDERKPLQAALIALDPRTGQVVAMVGGRDYGLSQFNRAVQARRQPGSAFKPIVTLAALAHSDREAPSRGERGSEVASVTLATVLEDAPFTLETRVGPWQPVNYDRRFSGPVTLREALERSLNVPFARLGAQIGPERIVQTARRMGIESPLNPFPSLALGSSEVSLLELTRAYGVLAAEGFRADLQPHVGILDGQGKLLDRPEPTGEQAYLPAETYLVTSALRSAVEVGTGRSLRALGYHGDVAAKSGTTNDFRDGWFVGYTPSLAVGVWVGYDDGRSIGRPGAAVALPIFARFLEAAGGPNGSRGPYGQVEFEQPSGLIVADVNPETGLLAGPGCPGQLELFLPETLPRESCSPWGRTANWSYRELRRRPGDFQRLAEQLLELRLLREREVRVESGRSRRDQEYRPRP
jgi:penicillin-binding protein 1B